jgi:hypothetical protein
MDAHAPDRPGQLVGFYARMCGCSPSNPQARYLKRVLDYAVEAAELDEPGAMRPPIKLNLSADASFRTGPEPVN